MIPHLLFIKNKLRAGVLNSELGEGAG